MSDKKRDEDEAARRFEYNQRQAMTAGAYVNITSEQADRRVTATDKTLLRSLGIAWD